MDIPLRHDFTLSGAWEILFPHRSSIHEGEDHQKEDVEAGLDLDVEDCAANVEVQVDEPEDADGLDGSDSDDTSINSAVAENHDYSQVLRLDSLLDQHRGPEILVGFASDHMAQTERLLQTIIIQNTNAERKEAWIELRGSVAANVIDPVERARKAMAQFEESTDSWEVKEERLRRALRIQIDDVQERKEESRGIIIQNLEFARKEEVVEEAQGEHYDGHDRMRNVIRSQNTLSIVPREKNVETEKSVRPSEGMSVEFQEMGLDIRGQENILHGKTIGPPGHCSIEGVSTNVQRMSIERQDTEPSENSKAKLFEEERSDMKAKNPQEQIYEMDAGQLNDEAENHDGSLHDLPNPVTEITGQEVPAGKGKAPTSTLQESGLGKQQQRERLNAMWRVSSAYVEPVAGIPNDPHLQTHDQDCSRHELPDDASNSGDAPPSHEILPLATTLQETSPTLATNPQHAMGDLTSLGSSTDSNPHPINSNTGEMPPEAAIEVTTAASLELLTADVDGQETSDIGACVAITEFDTGLSRFTLRTHILFSIIYAIWIAVLYRFITIALC